MVRMQNIPSYVSNNGHSDELKVSWDANKVCYLIHRKCHYKVAIVT